MKNSSLTSEIQTRPSTVGAADQKTPEIKPLNVTFSARKYSTNSLALGTNKKEFEEYLPPEYNSPKDVASLCSLIDCGTTEDEPEVKNLSTKPSPPQVQTQEKPTKLPPYKKSALNSIDSTSKNQKPTERKYIPTYNIQKSRTSPVKPTVHKYGTCGATSRDSKTHHQLKMGEKKIIPLTDELKSSTNLRLEQTDSLMQTITEEIQRQLKNLDDNDEATSYLIQLLNDSPKMENVEARIGQLEGKFDTLVNLLHELRMIKGPQLKIKLEEYDLEKLNSKLSLHPSMQSPKESSAVASCTHGQCSDLNLHQENYYALKQKMKNLESASVETLKLNEIIPDLKRDPIKSSVLYPTQDDLKKSTKPISNIV